MASISFSKSIGSSFVVIKLEKMSMKVGFLNFGETVSPSDFVIVARIHAYSFPGLMVFCFELKMMSMNLVFRMIVSQAYFVGTQAWLPCSFIGWIFLQLDILKKKYVQQNPGMNIMKIVDKVAENLTRGR